MRKIFLSAGHGGTDPGASANGYIERDLAIEFRKLLVVELAKLGVTAQTDADQNALVQTLSWLKSKFTAKDVLFDIHWNAGGGTGVEVIIPDVASAFEKTLAQAIADKISSITGLKKRNGGVKPESATARKKLGWMRPTAENVLLEMCFIDSKADMAVYQSNKIELAKQLAAVLFNFSKL